MAIRCRRINLPNHRAAILLLTSNNDLLRRSINCLGPAGLDFSQMRLKGISPENYTLYKAAKCLYLQSSELVLDELADPELVSPEAFRLIVDAVQICRYGSAPLGKRNGEYRYGDM